MTEREPIAQRVSGATRLLEVLPEAKRNWPNTTIRPAATTSMATVKMLT